MCTNVAQFLIVFEVITVHPLTFLSGVKLGYFYIAGFIVNIFISEMFQNQINVITISLCVITLVPNLQMETIWLLLPV